MDNNQWIKIKGSRSKMECLKEDHCMARILIIDDDEEMQSLLKDFLEEDGFETDSVGNGVDAFRKLDTEPFDLIITDIRMPGLTGLDILPVLKRLQPNASILVITAFGGDEVYQRSRERGATAYLEKPIQFNKLRTLLHQLILSKARGDNGMKMV
jgi:two-component system response regulator (stage 0 sporulation protein F)